MPRIARVVVPGLPHHVTQRGNRPCGSQPFVKRLESTLGRLLAPRKRGRKPKEKQRKP